MKYQLHAEFLQSSAKFLKAFICSQIVDVNNNSNMTSLINNKAKKIVNAMVAEVILANNAKVKEHTGLKASDLCALYKKEIRNEKSNKDSVDEKVLKQEMIKHSKIDEDNKDNEALTEEISEGNEALSSNNASNARNISNLCNRNARAMQNDEKNDNLSAFMPKSLFTLSNLQVSSDWREVQNSKLHINKLMISKKSRVKLNSAALKSSN